METVELLLLTGFLLAVGVVVCAVASIAIYTLVKHRLGGSPAPLVSLVTHAARRFRLRDVILAGTATFMAGVSIGIHLIFGSEAVAKLPSGSTFDHFDFETFWYSAKALWEGRNIYYDTGHEAVSANPPVFTVLISPLGLLEAITAYKVYALIMLFISVG